MAFSEAERWRLRTALQARMQQTNDRIMRLRPWSLAACAAAGLTAAGVVGTMLGRWAAGGTVMDPQLLAGATVSGIMVLLVFRLLAPVLLRSLRQHRQWRDERQPSSASLNPALPGK